MQRLGPSHEFKEPVALTRLYRVGGQYGVKDPPVNLITLASFGGPGCR
jgi:hypothetical protein